MDARQNTACGELMLSALSDADLLANTRGLIGRSNQLLAALLAHLGELDARALYRLRACSSLFAYCVYELRLSEDEAVVIERGDVLHVDFGITAMRLNTDTQHMGYVLRDGETDAPAGLKQALLNSNRLQDIVVAELRPGRSGNEILAASRAKMKAMNIDGTVYSHPIGVHGHGAGPLIGLWDYQDGVPGRGDARVIPGMWYSIELQATTPVPEWNNQPVRSAQEEDVIISADGSVKWAWQRQTNFHFVRPR